MIRYQAFVSSFLDGMKEFPVTYRRFALLFSRAVVYGPMMVAEYLPYGIQKTFPVN